MRQKILLRHMPREQILYTGNLLKKHGIKHRIGNLIGLPDETFDQMLETVDLNIEVNPDLGLANIFVPFPGLDLTDFSVAGGFLDKDNIQHIPKDYFDLSVLNFTPEEKTQIYNLMCLFPTLIRFPVLFRTKWIFRSLMKLPSPMLRLIYNATYLSRLARIHKVEGMGFLKIRILLRYISGSYRSFEGLGLHWDYFGKKGSPARAKNQPLTEVAK